MTSSFSQKVYYLLKQVPAGKVTTYKALAKAMNHSAYQAIGQALKRNPDPPTIPCHRVIAVDGSIGGFAGKTQGKMIAKKIKLLRSEGIRVKKNKVQNFDTILFEEFKD